MVNLRILPLRMGHATGWSYPETGTVLTFLIFAIVGGRRPIVVDTATYGARKMHTRQALTLHRSKAETPAAACRAAGIDPSDVELILQTHLHWDHAGNANVFPNAELLVQRSELRYAIAPSEGELGLFDRLPGASAVWLRDLERMRLVEGDHQVEPGVRAIHLPGHTPGFQGFLVDTASGPYLIAGDTVPSYAHWRGDATRPHLVGPGNDPEEMQHSFSRIEALGASVIPGHDPEVVTAGPFG
jgi:glyoxylase-like metal-dependent hydrolase (beta-lactamase superfamily II)